MSTHSDAAQTLVEGIRAMRQQIPNFAIPDKAAQRKLGRVATVPPAFVELTAVAVQNNATLVRNGATDPAQSRDLLSYAESYAPVADELEALAAFIRHSVRLAKNKVGSEALTTFALARRLAKRPEHAELLPHVADMQRALGSWRKTKAQKPETPPPAKTPTQVS